MKKYLVLLLLTFLIIPVSYTQGTQTDPYVISSPENLQIISGELTESAYFQVVSEKPFFMSIRLLAPYENGYDANAHTISFLILDSARREVAFVPERSYFWSTAKVAEKYYFLGPAVNQSMPAGTYTVKLYSDSTGAEYSLAIGDKNSALYSGLIWQKFLEKSFLSDFLQVVGLMIISGCIVALYVANTISQNSKDLNRLAMDFYYKTRYLAWEGIALLIIGFVLQFAADILGILKSVFIILIAAHWIYFSMKVQSRFARVKGRALLTKKFQNYIRNHMTAMLVKVVILAALMAAMF